MPSKRQSPGELLLGNLELVRQLVHSAARRARLSADQADDFESFVRMRLLAHDGKALRSFAGRSSHRTYMTVVVNRLLLDFRNALLGKWRASAAARRQGAVAMRLEELVYRDGLSFDEASQVLRLTYKLQINEAELAALWAAMPPHRGRRSAERATAPEPDGAPLDPEAVLLRRAELAALRQALARRLAALPAADLLLLRLRFAEEASVVEVGLAMRLPHKPLYKRIDRLLATLREQLESDGHTARDVAALLADGWDACELDREPVSPEPRAQRGR